MNMTVEERRAVREALAPLDGEWKYTLDGIPFVCPACLGNEWMEGATAPHMEIRDTLPSGRRMTHLGCTECGAQISGEYILYDFCRNVPEDSTSWN